MNKGYLYWDGTMEEVIEVSRGSNPLTGVKYVEVQYPDGRKMTCPPTYFVPTKKEAYERALRRYEATLLDIAKQREELAEDEAKIAAWIDIVKKRIDENN